MIEAVQLAKSFDLPRGKEIQAVDNLSFLVHQGEVYGLLGANGAGKTTTLRMMLGLLRPTSGHAVIDGFSSVAEPNEVKRRVGFVSVTTGVYAWLTVRQMLLFFAELYGVEQDAAENRLGQLAFHLGLEEFLQQRCGTLSTGQKQRVNLARALIHQPPAVLLDEPSLGLDVMGSRVVQEYIQLLREQGKAVVLCTHRLDEAERLCDRFGILSHGRIMAEGGLKELQERTGKKSLHDVFWSLNQPSNENSAHHTSTL